MASVHRYGGKLDLCENIRKHLEGHGFKYLGKTVEGDPKCMRERQTV
jgi:hypothetical protein